MKMLTLSYMNNNYDDVMPAPAGRMLRRPGVYLALIALLSLFTGQAGWAQGRVVTGRVLAQEDGSGLPGVSVVVKGTTSGTATDGSGNYSLSVPGNETVLVFSFIGYVSQEVPVGAQSAVNVTLAPDVTALSEVVVVGYGTQKKEDLTGAVTAISAKDFNPGQITTPEQLITGKVAGVQITPSGAPGSGSRIRIRGGSSLNASNDPLVVIDGVPVDNSELKGSANALSLINPNDIESFNILKDASAAAIYGARAANGVIIITTKKGKQGDKLRVAFSSLVSMYTLPKKIDVLSGNEFRDVVNQRGNETQRALLGNTSTDWQDIIFQTAYSHDNNVSLSGSYKALPYRVSFGYLDQDGVLKTSNFNRASGTISLNPTFLKDHLKVNLNLKGSLTNNRFADQGAVGAAIAFDPTQPVYADNTNFGGYYEWTLPNGSPNINATRNPLSLLEQRRDVGNVKRSIGNLQLDYKFHFLPDLRANLNLGYDLSESEGSNFRPATMAAYVAQGGDQTRTAQTRTNKLLDFYLNYVKEIPGIKSRIDATAGYSYQDFIRDEPSFPTLNAEGNVITEALPPFKTQNTLIGFFGRVNYSLMDRYLVTANIRRDGSSRFGEANKWGVFPSLAFAWKINEEAFLKNVRFLSELKLRVGYGVTGQQEINLGDYPYLARYTLSDEATRYQFGNGFFTTLRPEGYDADIKWEETSSYNAGLDFGFMDGRITGSLDYYFKKTKDLLSLIDVPAGSNLTNRLLTNVGNMDTRGFEAALNFAALNTEKVRLDVGFNATYNQREITNLSKVPDNTSEGILIGGIGGVGNLIQIHSVDYQPYSFYVYKQVYNENGSPVEGLYVDLNGDGAVDNRDKYRYKNPDPRVTLGFNSQLTYDKWSLGFVMRGNIGNYVYNNVSAEGGVYNNITALGGFLNNVNRSVTETNFNRRELFSDYYVENASFLRMDNINLGYNFGRIFNDKADLRLTANVQNAFVITKYTGIDPETQTTGTGNDVTTGIDNNLYPRARVFSFGLNLGF